MPPIKFLAIAHAGASAEQVFAPWTRALGNRFDLVPLEYNGRGRRISERHHSTIEELADNFLSRIQTVIAQHEYVIYGHSMGCLVAYELAQRIKDAGLPPALRICLSGRNSPSFEYPSRHYHQLSDKDFIAELSLLDPKLSVLFENSDMREVFLPILRSDYRLLGGYEPRVPSPDKSLASDILFFLSDLDPLVERTEVFKWQDYGGQEIRLFEFSGGHFFLHENFDEICKHIQRDIEMHSLR